MGRKVFIYIFVFIGGALGGYIPTLWGSNAFGLASIIGSVIGGFLGIWVGYKLSRMIEG